MRIVVERAVIRPALGSAPIGPFDCTLSRGLTALTGSNGAGKTTLIKAVCGLIQPVSGTVRLEWEGVPLSPLDAKRRLGYVPQDMAVYEDMTPCQYWTYIASLKCLEKSRISQKIGMLTERFRLESLVKRKIGDLSAGEQRLCMIVQAFLAEPSYVLLDEPFVGLSVDQRLNLHDFLQDIARFAVVLVATHFVEEIKPGDYDRILTMREGTLLEGG